MRYLKSPASFGTLFRPALIMGLLVRALSMPLSSLAAGGKNPVPPAQQLQNQAAGPQGPAAAPGSELYDIKGPILIPDNTRTLLIIAAVLLAAVLLAALGWFLYKRSRRQKAILAHETALANLGRAERLIEKGEVEAFVTLIDQTLRSYIEQRFAVSARNRTTREFISRITEKRQQVPSELAANTQNLQTWLEHCDLVKFARGSLDRTTMENMLTNLRAFIESTRMEAKK